MINWLKKKWYWFLGLLVPIALAGSLQPSSSYTQVSLAGTKQFVKCDKSDYPITAKEYADLATNPIPQFNGENCTSAYQTFAFNTTSGDLEPNDYVDVGNKWYANVKGNPAYYPKSGSFDSDMTALDSKSPTSTPQ